MSGAGGTGGPGGANGGHRAGATARSSGATGAGWLVVGSPAAGSTDEGVIESVAGRLARQAPVEVAVTGDPDELDTVLRRHDGRTLVVVGGDGSAHVVVNGLARAGLLDVVPVGFVPFGTANDFATHLGMEADVRAAADQLLDARRAQLDLLRVEPAAGDPELVVNAAHAGLGVDAAARATPWKRWLGRVAYPAGVVVEGVRSGGIDTTVRVDGHLVGLDGPVLALAVANAPRLGGVELVRDARSDDGALDVLAVPARPWTARVGAVRHLLGRDGGPVRTFRGRTVELAGDVGTIDADGEELEVGPSCRLEVVPGALTALVPGPA